MIHRRIALLLAVLMLAGINATLAESDVRELVVANPTKLNGMFFTDRWGNNTSDVDVRTLLHGLGTVAHHGDGSLSINPTVVRDYRRDIDAVGNVTYTLILWDDLYFSDGSPITAADYVGSVLLQASPQLRALSGNDSRSYEHLLVYEDYSTGKTLRLEGLRLLDEHRLSVTIDARYLPYYYELNLVDITPYPMTVLWPELQLEDDTSSLRLSGPIDQQVLAQRLMGEDGYISNPKVTSGPYRLLSYDTSTGEARFERNPFFKGNELGVKPQIERIILMEAVNETMVDDLLKGQIDLINKMSWNSAIVRAKHAASQEKIQVKDYDRRGLAFLYFAGDEGPTASIAVRRAIASIVNRARIVDEALRSNGKPVYGYYGLGQDVARGKEDELKKLLDIYPYNLNRAEALLIEDGWLYAENGKELRTARGTQRYRSGSNGLEPLTLRMAITQNNPIGEYVAKHLGDNLRRIGGTLLVDRLDTVTFFQHYYRQVTMTYDILFLGSNFGMVFDPLSRSLPHELENTAGATDALLPTLSDEMRRTNPGDMLSYQLKWQRFQQRFVEQLPLLPLYSNIYYDAFSSDLVDYRPDAYFSWAQAIVYASWRNP